MAKTERDGMEMERRNTETPIKIKLFRMAFPQQTTLDVIASLNKL
jgi:hypothetical protein